MASSISNKVSILLLRFPCSILQCYQFLTEDICEIKYANKMWFRPMMIQLKMKKNCPNEKSKSEKVGVEISCRRPNIYSIILVYRVGCSRKILFKFSGHFYCRPFFSMEFSTLQTHRFDINLGLLHESSPSIFFRFGFQSSGVKLLNFFTLVVCRRILCHGNSPEFRSTRSQILSETS